MLAASHSVTEPGFAWPRYGRILVVLDATPAAAFALRHAVAYAVDHGSRLTLLTVVAHPRAFVVAAGVLPQSLAVEMEREAVARQRHVIATLPQGVSVTSIVRHGDAADEILRVVDEQHVDLVCIGAQGRGRVAGALLGSVSQTVVRRSPVPVVMLAGEA